MKEKKFGIAITTGDTDGIGLEISAKALARLGPNRHVTFFLIRSGEEQNHLTAKLRSRFRTAVVTSLKQALLIDRKKFDLVEVLSPNSPAIWVRDAAQLCQKKKLDGMATAPLSKTEIKRAGLKAIGHTEILQRVAQSKYVFMAFHGSKMNVVLATGHVRIQDLKLTPARLKVAILSAENFRKRLAAPRRNLPIGLVALNPHAGEKGIIGPEEVRIHKPVIDQLRRRIKVEGPLVPDVIFAKERWKKYSVLVASYHDQGLIPFKLLHGFSDPGVHLTLGIPFVRTSVDHGTAKDIFGLNKADPRSMQAAIKMAVTMVERR